MADIETPRPRTKRVRTPLIVSGLLVLAASVGGALWLFNELSAERQVLAVVQQIERGDIIDREALGTVPVPAEATFSTVSPAEQDAILGSTALVTMQPGTLLSPDLFDEQLDLEEGYVLIGLVAASGEIPSGSVGVGDYLSLLDVGVEGEEAVEVARVEIDQIAGEEGARFMTMLVPQELASTVTILASRGTLRAAQIPDLEADPLTEGLDPEDLIGPIVTDEEDLENGDDNGDPQPEPEPEPEPAPDVDVDTGEEDN